MKSDAPDDPHADFKEFWGFLLFFFFFFFWLFPPGVFRGGGIASFFVFLILYV